MAEQIRILMVITNRCARTGLTAVALNYALSLSKDGVTVDFVCVNRPEESLLNELTSAGGRVFQLPMRQKRPLTYARRLSRLIRREGYQVVHVHGNSCTMAFDLLGAKWGGAAVRIAHSHNTTCSFRLAHRLLRPLFEFTLTHRCACSTEAGQWLFGQKPFTLIRNGVDARRFAFDPEKRRAARAALSLRENTVLLLNVGSLIPRKNQAFLPPLLQALTGQGVDAVLALAGSGPEEGSLIRQAQALGLGERVRLLGSTPDPSALYCAADAFLLPSLNEGLPLTLIEAQCAGLWCLAADTVSQEGNVGGRTAFLPIDSGVSPWIAELKRVFSLIGGEDRREYARFVQEAGFDIRSNALALQTLYRQWLGKEAAAHGAE